MLVALSKMMYSYEGPVMGDPSGFFATGTVIFIESKPVAPKSHPIETMV